MKKLYSLCLPLLLAAWLPSIAGAWQPSSERVPEPRQEFRSVWVASVYNLDWPSRAGLSAQTQQRQLINILNTCANLKINAVFLQVRPNSDALYRSSYEPWSQWLSGAGVNPGYDPLAFAVDAAHARGIELHAWLNPFRAKANVDHSVGRGHISLTRPELMKRAGSTLVADPGMSGSRSHALKVVKDIVSRYDIDGIHIDDYFYPYPPAVLRDGKSPSERRAYIDDFVSELYGTVKSQKKWVRVGISPFGIWKPGVPAGIEAGVNAYDDLGCDARKWLAKGWVDYLAPQLYWRCSPQKQSFPLLMQWWVAQNTSRPVWPGIATARIQSSEDPGRPASEIAQQIQYSRSLSKCAPGQCFWSANSIINNKGGIQSHLRKLYPDMAIPPAMPWLGSSTPGKPALTASSNSQGILMKWTPADNSARKWAIQAKYGSSWQTICLLPGNQTAVTLPSSFISNADSLAVRAISAFGNAGAAAATTR